MKNNNNQLTIFMTRVTLIISVLVGISLPIVYGSLAYYDLGESLRFKAKLKAHSQIDLITTMPNTWMFAENRINGRLQREPVVLDNEFLQLYDVRGRLITSTGSQVMGLIIKRSYPLYDIDTVVGQVMISASLTPILFYTMKVALLGLVLGLLILTVMRLIPIRHLKRMSDELYQEKERAVITLHSISDVVLRTDMNARLLFINEAGEKMLGLMLRKIKGQPLSDILYITDSATGSPKISVLMDALTLKIETSCDGKSMLDVPSNKIIAIEERASPIFDHTGKLTGAVLCLRDVSIARSYLERRSWEASHDALTEILNRRAFENRINIAIKHARNNENNYALCFIDLDRFKIVNDSCGHAAGDELLIKITRLIASKIRGGDVLARLGGDEFGLLLEGCDAVNGKLIANELIDEISKFKFFWDTKTFTIGMSIGLTLITNQSVNVRDVLSEADSACYWVKENGRNQVHFFLASDMELALRRNQTGWVARITEALKKDKFVLYHQTYRSLNNNNTDMRFHMEVLIRMLDNNGDIILPAIFLPAAERYDLIKEIDRWVINKIFSEFHHLVTRYNNQKLMININLSGASIKSNKQFEFIKEKILEFNIDPPSICFEMTETVVVKDINASIKFIQQCKEIGIKVALDNFGTSSSSFEYLKSVAVDYLKINGNFVKDIETDAVDREMLASINRISHLMGKITIAEFAENESIICILDEIGVDFAQGYGVCLPKPLFIETKIRSAV